PRVSEHARALIRRSARFRSEPSEPNSYWTVVDAGLSGAHASGSKLIASGSRISFVAKAANAESPNVSLGALRLGLLSFSLSHSLRRARASSGRSEKRTPARPRDRKSTRLNSSHQIISYAVFCSKNKNRPTSRIKLK